eukprot:CAMPEP_0185723812 /NCGR_PEP_ID=MMETSP1171-20130828/523_1 /TAXON_ID=374046 /ORGANISM="Helicotheca tamensis, Strain CCMP826" /LENGTH=466 /DNA_ID=CAMNT_0028391565 /DNA_START=73 /DNA_END=1473 /DNA_ORIENTATION=+
MRCMGKKTSANESNLDEHIGIIGAGPAGIAAAWFLLKKKGYKNVTVLEAEEEVGGKCRTTTYTDQNKVTNNYELGAEYITYAYDLIFQFMKEVDAKTKTAGTIMTIMGDGKFIDAAKSEPFLKVLPAAMRYLKILKKYKKIIANPSNAGVAADPFLSQSSKDFIASNKLDALKPLFLVGQFGYGSLEDFPAIDLMRTVPLSTMRRTIIQQIPIIRLLWKRPVASLAVDGLQNLFQSMASELDEEKARKTSGGNKAVLLGEKVIKISKVTEENSPPLLVETTKGTHKFDKIICAVPPNLVAGFVDFLSEDAKEHMMKFKYHPYYVGCIDPDHNLPAAYYQNQTLNPGEPVQFSKRWADSPIMAYGYNWVEESEFQPGNTQGEELLQEKMKTYLKENMLIDSYTCFKGGIAWNNYHPHVPIEDYQAGYFDKLEAYQGIDGIFLAGDAMSMESMECSCKYSEQLVNEYF